MALDGSRIILRHRQEVRSRQPLTTGTRLFQRVNSGYPSRSGQVILVFIISRNLFLPLEREVRSNAGLTIITEVPRLSRMLQTWANRLLRTSSLSLSIFFGLLFFISSACKSSTTLCLEAHISLNAYFTERKGRVYLRSKSLESSPRSENSTTKSDLTHT